MQEGEFNSTVIGPVLRGLGFFPKIVGGGLFQEKGLPDFFGGGFFGLSIGIEVKHNDNRISTDQAKIRDKMLPHSLWFLYRYYDNPNIKHQFKCWNSGRIYQLPGGFTCSRVGIARIFLTEGKEFLEARWKNL